MGTTATLFRSSPSDDPVIVTEGRLLSVRSQTYQVGSVQTTTAEIVFDRSLTRVLFLTDRGKVDSIRALQGRDVRFSVTNSDGNPGRLIDFEPLSTH